MPLVTIGKKTEKPGKSDKNIAPGEDQPTTSPIIIKKMTREAKVQQLRMIKYLSVVSKPVRLSLAFNLIEGDRSVSELATSIGTTQPNVSHCLTRMTDTGVVEKTRQGKQNFYRITDTRLINLLHWMKENLV